MSRRAGGVFDANRQLARALHAAGDDVRVFGVADASTEDDRAAWDPVPVAVAAAHGPRRLGFAPQLSPLLRTSDPEIVHTHGLWTYASRAVLQWHRSTRRPHVVHPHGMLDPWALRNGRWKKRLAALLYENAHLREAACLRALCLAELEAVRAAGYTNPVCLIPNGVSLPDRPSAESPGATAQSGKSLLYLGRLHPKKGLAHLLKGWAMAGAPAEWHLTIAGWDEAGHAADLKQLATTLGLSWEEHRDGNPPAIRSNRAERASIRFTGPLFGQAKDSAYRNCSAFVLPSLSEGLPMTVLEAWSHRKPVLMTAACNLPEGVAANAALEILPTAEGVAEGLRQCFALDDQARRAIGSNGYRLVEDRFAWPQVAARLRTVNAWLVNGGDRPECVVL